MKIAFINIYQNKVERGGETFVRELSKRLSKMHSVDILTKIDVGKIFQEKYDIIIPLNGRFQAVFVRVLTWIYGGRVVISGQSGIGFDDRLNLYTFPDAFVGLTDFQADWARRINPFVRVEKIPNGVDLSSFRGESFKGGKTVLEVGAFTKEKRHDLTIKAVAKIKNTKLVVVGSTGDQEQYVKSLGKDLLGNNFDILSLPHEKLPEVYRKASVLTFPSVPWESFGIVLVEAMASGLGVVVTDDPIRREIVGNAGIFVNPEDSDAYALSIKEALAKKWREKAIAQAKKFDWDIITGAYERLFESIKK